MAQKPKPEDDLPFDVTRLPAENFKAPDIIGTVEGWRAWIVDIELPRYGVPLTLGSAVHDFYWTPRQLAIAKCDHDHSNEDPPGPPGETCGCGFYSARTFDHLMTMPYPKYQNDEGTFRVIGKVANWGKVVVGTLGWRAQKSYPVELYIPYEYAATHAKALRDSYGVPVRMKNFLTPGHAII